MNLNPFNHIDLRVSNIEAALPFYEMLMPALGFSLYRASQEAPSGVVWEVFVVEGTRPSIFFSITEEANHDANRNCIAFYTASRAEVDRIAQIVSRAGGQNIKGPRECPEYAEGYYAVYFEDPSGNRLEVVNCPS